MHPMKLFRIIFSKIFNTLTEANQMVCSIEKVSPIQFHLEKFEAIRTLA